MFNNSNNRTVDARDFLRLGLRRGESCTQVIHQAIHNSVRRLISNCRSAGELEKVFVDRQVGLLAASAYRVLDPRYRIRFFERVQLSYPVDRDDQDSATSTTQDLWSVPKALIDTSDAISSWNREDGSHQEADSVELSDAREIVRYLRRLDTKNRRRRYPLAKRIQQSIRLWWRNRRAS